MHEVLAPFSTLNGPREWGHSGPALNGPVSMCKWRSALFCSPMCAPCVLAASPASHAFVRQSRVPTCRPPGWVSVRFRRKQWRCGRQCLCQWPFFGARRASEVAFLRVSDVCVIESASDLRISVRPRENDQFGIGLLAQRVALPS